MQVTYLVKCQALQDCLLIDPRIAIKPSKGFMLYLNLS